MDGAANSSSFFRTLPYRNFFRYPPLRPIGHITDATKFRLLALDTSASTEYFTIYVSVPFCVKRCHSCTYFVSPVSPGELQSTIVDQYVEGIQWQTAFYGGTARFRDRTCKAVYFGGGTASLLSSENVKTLITELRRYFRFSHSAEFTLEGNPREFTRSYLEEIHEAGITRVSIGLQSTQDVVLSEVINAPHGSREGVDAVQSAIDIGFRDVNVDLLYRLPGQKFGGWLREVETIGQIRPPSITTYKYLVHAGSVAERLINAGRLEPQATEESAQVWYRWTRDRLKSLGYEESSHGCFCQAGHTQQYSLYTYGYGCELIGMGPKAYSYINGYQFAAPESLTSYLKQLDAGEYPLMDRLSPAPSQRNLMQRYVIFNLRRSSRVDSSIFLGIFGHSLAEVFTHEINLLVENGVLEQDTLGIKLTELGVLWRNNVLNTFYDPAFEDECLNRSGS